jgi:hypothetical protein
MGKILGLAAAIGLLCFAGSARAANDPVTLVSVFNTNCFAFQINNVNTWYWVNISNDGGKSIQAAVYSAYSAYLLNGKTDFPPADIYIASTYTDGTCGVNSVSNVQPGV